MSNRKSIEKIRDENIYLCHSSKIGNNKSQILVQLAHKIKKYCFFIAALTTGLSCGFGSTPADDSFQVAPRNGVPLLLRNDHPVAPRMIWVRTDDQTALPIFTKFQEFQLKFEPRFDSDAAAILFTVMNNNWAPGDIDFLDLRVEDAVTGKELKRYRFDQKKPDSDCLYWCRKTKTAPVRLTTIHDQAYTNGLLRLSFFNGSKRMLKLAGFTLSFGGLKVKKNNPILLRGKVRSGVPRVLTGGLFQLKPQYRQCSYPGPTISQLKMAHDVGVDLVTVKVPGVWVEPGKRPDYSRIDEVYEIILHGNPNAKIIPRVYCGRPPAWWVKRHPKEMMRYTNGGDPVYASIASEQWRHDAANALRNVIRYSEKHYGRHMAGYHPAGGHTNEWFYPQSWNRISGYDHSTCDAWRKFLYRRYGNDKTLRQAWGRKNVSIATAVVPTEEQRRGKNSEAFLNPKQRDLLDFVEFWQENIIDAALEQSKIVREETGKRRLSLLFYGYLLHFGWTGAPPSNTGHYALKRLLKSPDVDIVAGPISYFGRQFGEVGSTMTVAESIALAGKIWLNEDDTSTHLARLYGNRAIGWRSSTRNLKETIAVLQRNLLTAELRNFGTWWMDLCGTGAFNDSALWQQMKTIDKLTTECREHPLPYRPTTAEIIDEHSMLYLSAAGSTAATKHLLYEDRVHRAKTGATFGSYMLEDLLADKVPSNLNYIVSAWVLNREQRQKLFAISRKKPTFWCWATGLIDRDTGKFSVKTVEETTGFRVKILSNVTFTTQATPAGIAFGLAPTRHAEVKHPVTPALSPIPRKGDVVLATYSDRSPAIVFRPGRIPAVFSGTPIIDVGAYHGFIKKSRIHLVADKIAGVVANNGFFAVFPLENGRFTINVGNRGPVWDLLEKKELGKGPVLYQNLKKGEVKLYKIKKRLRF